MELPLNERTAWGLYQKAKQITKENQNQSNIQSGDYNYIVFLENYVVRFPKPGIKTLSSGAFREPYGAQVEFTQRVGDENSFIQIPEVFYYSYSKGESFAIIEAIPNLSTPVTPRDLRVYVRRAKESIKSAGELARVSMLDDRLEFIKSCTRIPVDVFVPYLQEDWPIYDTQLSTAKLINHYDRLIKYYFGNEEDFTVQLLKRYGIDRDLVGKTFSKREVESLQKRPPVFVHLDLRPYNIAYPNDRSSRQLYILDFDDIVIGDPLLALAICFSEFPDEYIFKQLEKMGNDEFLSKFLQGWRKDIQFYQRLVAIHDLLAAAPFIFMEKNLLHLERVNKVLELCLGLEPIPISKCPWPINYADRISIYQSRLEFEDLRNSDRPKGSQIIARLDNDRQNDRQSRSDN